jgi:DNA (cytosine-5)-methyltransferase 1
VAFRNDIDSSKFSFPKPHDSKKRIKHIIEEKPVSAKYYLSEVYLEGLRNHRARHEAKGNGFGYEIRDWEDVAAAIVCGGMGRERNLLVDKRQKNLTPVTHIKGKINAEGVRRMTPREWARLQGFPDDFQLPVANVHLYKQLGNTVTVPVIEAIATKIKQVLENQSAQTKRSCVMSITGNKGEWSEIYIFLKLMYDRKVYAADKDMNKLNNVFLNIVKIIREELRNQVYEYRTGDIIKIYLNGNDTDTDVPEINFKENKDKLYNLMLANVRGTFGDVGIENFLNSIYITKLKAPAINQSEFFGGTQDITMAVMDYRSGITETVGFSCKSVFGGRSTLFNASKDNTNFVYEVTGPITDELMSHFNSLFKSRGKKQVTAVGDRIRALKKSGCSLKFVSPATKTTERNLVLSGGNELPEIVGDALKYYYWESEGGADFAPIYKAIGYVIANNPAGYAFNDIESIYKRKFSNLLYDMFTGMRMKESWDGRSSVNGGYIVMKSDGDVVAYHSCIADEFKDFLLNKLGFETPSASRHEFMQIYKKNGKYYLKLNLQVRFI